MCLEGAQGAWGLPASPAAAESPQDGALGVRGTSPSRCDPCLVSFHVSTASQGRMWESPQSRLCLWFPEEFLGVLFHPPRPWSSTGCRPEDCLIQHALYFEPCVFPVWDFMLLACVCLLPCASEFASSHSCLWPSLCKISKLLLHRPYPLPWV